MKYLRVGEIGKLLKLPISNTKTLAFLQMNVIN